MTPENIVARTHGSVYPPPSWLLDHLPVMPSAIGSDLVTNHTYGNNLMHRGPSHFVIFQYTLAGCGELTDRGKVFELPAGRAFLVEAPGPFSYRQPNGSPFWHFLYLSLEGETAIELCRRIFADKGPVLTMPSESTAIRLLCETLISCREKGFQDIHDSSSFAYRFMLTLLREQLLPVAGGREKIPPNLERAAFYIDKHLADRQLDVAAMARIAGCSRFYFTRQFRKYYGLAPGEYLLFRRLARAAELLAADCGTPIKSIIADCGFISEAYFCRAFRKRFRLTTGAYRARIRSRPGEF